MKIMKSNMSPLSKKDIIRSSISLVIALAFLCFSIKKVYVDHADWNGAIWVFGSLTIFLSILIVIGIIYLRRKGNHG